MRILIATAAATLIAFNPAMAEFLADLDTFEVIKANGSFTVNDLAVGEVGVLQSATLCNDGGRIFLDTTTTLESKTSEYGVNMRVRRLPESKIELIFQPGAKASISPDKAAAELLVRATRMKCSEMIAPEGRRIVVDTINGATSTSELMERSKNP
ncbi:hypothetical protein OCK02_17105 [Rhizobium sp. TRM96647]|uniref:hypothetical protein n=1 Tax=unclassified Rhizobium TaxID=2613769 RepID=UPI0021E7EE67|nr:MULTISPECIES: hypothetical protein [unclassified Rhizobium]MCV3737923.1 hypothetical protein [Rhizobium sp. TRM96647]MCV3759347.1 hypothetical protein [Rhizobium sp. TRM96650]